MTGVRELWEARARDMGASRRGVLFKGFSEPANAALDAWHQQLVRNVLAPEVRPDGILLLLLTLGGKLGWRWINRMWPRDGIAGGYSALALLLRARDEKPA